MSQQYVFDTGPLSAFARAGRLDLLETRYSGKGAWTVEARDEIRRGLSLYAELQVVLEASWLGQPIRLTDPEHLQEIERVRWALGGTPKQPERHRGEAATIVVAELQGAVAVLDERDGRRLAGARGIPIIGTVGILKACVRDGQAPLNEAWEVLSEMRRLRFHMPPWATKDYLRDP